MSRGGAQVRRGLLVGYCARKDHPRREKNELLAWLSFFFAVCAALCLPHMAEDEEVEWLKKQFDPTQNVPKGTAIKIQVRVAAVQCMQLRDAAVS